jgi:hypothetical protein
VTRQSYNAIEAEFIMNEGTDRQFSTRKIVADSTDPSFYDRRWGYWSKIDVNAVEVGVRFMLCLDGMTIKVWDTFATIIYRKVIKR